MTTVLIVDDMSEIRDLHREWFVGEGVSVIEAQDRDEAIKIFRSNQRVISGVVTDLRLEDDDDPNDKSGIAIARSIKNMDSGIPIACVSAFSFEEQLLDDVFDFTFRKQTRDSKLSLRSNISELVSQFDLFESHRYSEMPVRLRDLQIKYRISEDDFLTLISALPVSTKSQLALLKVHEFLDEDIDAETGSLIGIRFVEPNSDMGKRYGITNSVPVALRSSNFSSEVVAELYGIPSVFAYGSNEHEAVKGLLDNLSFYKNDLVGTNASNADLQILRFSRYLNEVFQNNEKPTN